MANATSETIDNQFRDNLYEVCKKSYSPAFDDFYEAVGKARSKGPKKFNYQMLDQLMQALNMNVSEAFKFMTGQDLYVPEDVKHILQALERMTDTQKENLLYALQLALPWWAHFEHLQPYKPTKNIINAYESLKKTGIEPPDSVEDIQSFKKAILDRKFMTRIHTDDILKVANELDISLHWVLYPTSNVYSSNPFDDKIIDAYWMMEKDCKEQFYQAMMSYKEGE